MTDAASAVAERADALILFGLTGDLARKKLIPALYRLEAADRLGVPVIGVASSNWTIEELRVRARTALEEAGITVDTPVFDRLAGRLSYVSGDYRDAAMYRRLAEAVGAGPCPVAYLAIPPGLFSTVVDGLAAQGLNRGRVVVEKPFGRDTATSRQLDAAVTAHVPEERIFRIDHFLGKEPVLNLLVFRFANAIFEPLWNRHHVRQVTVSLDEAYGVEGRGRFYDEVGALRDVVQNHLLAVVALLAMEPPVSEDADALADEMAKVLMAMRPFEPRRTRRAQYQGYRDEVGVAPESGTETAFATTTFIDSWRWAGVPWVLTTAKAAAETRTEAIVDFVPPPRPLFADRDCAPGPNRLRFELKPDDEITLDLQVKSRGDRLVSESSALTVDHRNAEQGPDAYQRLLGDALDGDRRLFGRGDLIVRAWEIVQPVLDNPPDLCLYTPGTIRGLELAGGEDV